MFIPLKLALKSCSIYRSCSLYILVMLVYICDMGKAVVTFDCLMEE